VDGIAHNPIAAAISHQAMEWGRLRRAALSGLSVFIKKTFLCIADHPFG
jgi:hypothetical protein